MKSMFQSEEARASMVAWHERFRAAISKPLESRRLTTLDGETHVLVGGPPEGEPLVLMHGALASSAHLLHELEPLADRFCVYAVDVIGQSVMSADTQLDVRTEAYGRWASEVLDLLQLDRAHVVGVSWGGFVAQQLATMSPERIRTLTLLVPAGVVPSPFSSFWKLGVPLAMYRSFPSEARRAKLLGRLLSTPDDELWGPFLAEAFRAYRLDMRVPALTKDGQLADLRAPTMVVAADADLSFPGAKLLTRAAELFPRLETTELIEGRHCPPTTDEFRRWLSERISRFIESTSLPAAAE